MAPEDEEDHRVNSSEQWTNNIAAYSDDAAVADVNDDEAGPTTTEEVATDADAEARADGPQLWVTKVESTAPMDMLKELTTDNSCMSTEAVGCKEGPTEAEDMTPFSGNDAEAHRGQCEPPYTNATAANDTVMMTPTMRRPHSPPITMEP